MHNIYIKACKDPTKQWMKLHFVATNEAIFNVLKEWHAPDIAELERSAAQKKKDGAKLRITQLEGNNSSRSIGSTGSSTEGSQAGKGHNNSDNSSTESSHKGKQGPRNTFARLGSRRSRNRRRRREPTDRVHTVEAPTPGRASRIEEEGQGLEIVHSPNHPN